MERRLAAILAADVVGYSRLMGEDEAATLAALKAHRAELIDPKAAQYNGRTIKLMGDGALMEFPSVVEAVTFAVEMQLAMAARNRDLPEDRQVRYRIGINIGDIIVEGDDIYGDGVNIAARLESLAEAGGICVRRNVRNQVRDKLDLDFEDRGEIEVKNIARPIRVFSVVLDHKAEALVTPVEALPAQTVRRRRPAIAAALVLALAAAGGLAWWQPWAPEFEPARAESMALPLPDKPSIAVLAFDNMTGDPGQEYFSDGFAESLITELARDRELFVVARNSSFTYKGKPVEIRQVAEELGVRYVIEGSVQRSDGKVRISAQLIDATAGNHVWAERYDRPAKDLFAIQDEIVGSIVASVRGYRGSLQRAETERRARSSTDDLGAHDLVLRGIMHKDRFTEADNRRAAELFRQAIERDPDYAAPHAWLAFTHSLDVFLGWSKDPAASIEAGYKEAQQAVSFDSSLDVAHWALGTMHLLVGKADEALASFQKALQLNPNNADVMADIAWPLYVVGRAEEGIASVKRAMRLNPRHPEWYHWALGSASYSAVRYEDAVAALNRMTNQNLDSRLVLAASYARLGRIDEAAVQVAAAVKLDPEISIETQKEHFPISNPTVEAHYYDGLRLAGLPETPPLEAPDEASIIVLPFDDLSADAGLGYFADGMTEDVITELARWREIKVIARNSSFTYKGKAIDVRTVAEEMDVRYVLEGSVRMSGDKLRINAQLIDGATGHHVWADRFDETGADVLALQDRVTDKIVATLGGSQGAIQDAEYERAWAKAKVELDEYDYYLRGHEIFYHYTLEGNARAREIWQEGLAKYPDSGLLRIKLGWTHMIEALFGWAEDREGAMAAAAELADEGLADESLPAAGYRFGLWLRAYANLYYRQDYEATIRDAKAVVAAFPYDSESLFWMGEVVTYAGELDLSDRWIGTALERDVRPIPSYFNAVGRLRYAQGKYEETVQAFKKGLPGDEAIWFIAASYAALGKLNDAGTYIDKLKVKHPHVTPDYIRALVPFRDKAINDHLLAQLAKAGWPE